MSMQPPVPPKLRLAWPTGPAAPALSGPEVHAWALALDVAPEVRAALAPLLSPDERERAARFRFELHRNRFIVGRAVLRLLLGRYLQAAPAAFEFAYGPQGKPALAGTAAEYGPSLHSGNPVLPSSSSSFSSSSSTPPRVEEEKENEDEDEEDAASERKGRPVAAGAGLHFNLAHSENLALLAFTHESAIGVDVECLKPMPDADQLVARFFSPREQHTFQQLPAAQKRAAFFNLWTRKEAWLKATGQGIGHLLNQVEVSFLPGEPAQLLRLPKPWRGGDGPSPASAPTASPQEKLLPTPGFAVANWTLHDLSPAPGFTGALALGQIIHSRGRARTPVRAADTENGRNSSHGVQRTARPTLLDLHCWSWPEDHSPRP